MLGWHVLPFTGQPSPRQSPQTVSKGKAELPELSTCQTCQDKLALAMPPLPSWGLKTEPSYSREFMYSALSV